MFDRKCVSTGITEDKRNKRHPNKIVGNTCEKKTTPPAVDKRLL
jgi:hypothetical protein